MARNDSPSSASRASSTNFSSQHTVVEHPSATDLVGLVSNRLDGEASRATLAYADAQTGRETDRQQAGFSTFVTASREASFASQAGEAAGAINATNSLPALVPSASPSLPEGRSLSRQHSGTCASRRASLNSSERESTWVSRVTAKTEDLRCMFQLPEDEVSSRPSGAFASLPKNFNLAAQSWPHSGSGMHFRNVRISAAAGAALCESCFS